MEFDMLADPDKERLLARTLALRSARCLLADYRRTLSTIFTVYGGGPSQPAVIGKIERAIHQIDEALK